MYDPLTPTHPVLIWGSQKVFHTTRPNYVYSRLDLIKFLDKKLKIYYLAYVGILRIIFFIIFKKSIILNYCAVVVSGQIVLLNKVDSYKQSFQG